MRPEHAIVPHAPDGRLPAAEVLTRVSDELTALQSMAGQLQDVVGELARGRQIAAPSLVTRLQDMDRLTQSIACIADFVGRLGSGMPAAWTVDAGSAARTLPLADLALRLSQEEPCCTLLQDAKAIEPAGEADFF